MNILKIRQKGVMFGLECRALKKQFWELFLASMQSVGSEETHGASIKKHQSLKLGVMFGLECRALKKQFWELFLASMQSVVSQETHGASIKKHQSLKLGVMFGLDARIALVVLAVVSLSIGFVQEKEIFEHKEEQTKQEMKLLEAKFLKFWEELRFNGYYTAPETALIYNGSAGVAEIPGYNKEKKYKFIEILAPGTVFQTFTYWSDDYSHPHNSDTYKIAVRGIDNKLSMLGYFFNKDGYFSTAHSYFTNIGKDIAHRVELIFNKFKKEDGAGSIGTDYNFDPEPSRVGPIGPFYKFDKSRFSLDKDIQIYYIVEHNIDVNAPSDYILNVIMYTKGQNGKLDTTMPLNLVDLANFAGAQGDDIVNIFSTKDIYLRAKAEGLRRLEEIREKVSLVAESTYLDRLSLCSSESTPSASCDLDTDGDYDVNDENLMVDYNPYPKSSLDTSSAKYYNSSTAFDYTSVTGSETFLSTTLGLPEYYGTDLFGNKLNFQSNVGLKTKGPYTMEVWY